MPLNIGVDMDGPISNTDPILRMLLEHRIKRRIHPHEVTDWHYWKCIPEVTEEMVYEILDEFHNQWLLDVPVVPGAAYGIKTLQKMGFSPAVVTFRAASAYDTTFQYMLRNNIYIPLLMSLSTDKVQVCQDNNISIMIEDRYETAVQLAKAGIQVLMTNFPWNANKPHVDGIRRVYSWVDIVDVFKSGYFNKKENK